MTAFIEVLLWQDDGYKRQVRIGRVPQHLRGAQAPELV